MMNQMMPTLLQELKVGAQALYGNRLKGLYLFGSYARDEADEESDVDVLVVLDDIQRYAAEVGRLGALTSTLSLKYGVSLSEVFIRESEWLRGETPFLANVREEALPV